MVQLGQQYSGFVFFLILGIMSSLALTGGNSHSQPQTPLVTEQPTKCLPCEGLDLSSRLSHAHVVDRATTLSLWSVVPLGTTEIPSSRAADVSFATVTASSRTADEAEPMFALSRKFTARNFQAAMDALNAMGVIAERENHHFDFHLTNYRNVKIDIYTHSVQGLTENDFILAHLLDTVPVDYSPKWLKENLVVNQNR